jgi:predicted secreted protein
MSNYPAVEFVLMVPDVSSPSTYVSVATLTNVQMERTNTDEDISTKGDARNRKLYPEGAQRAMSVTADFVADSSAPFDTLKDAAFHATNPSLSCRLDDGESTFTGTFQISNFSLQGGAFGAVTGSITLNSSGAITKAAS